MLSQLVITIMQLVNKESSFLNIVWWLYMTRSIFFCFFQLNLFGGDLTASRTYDIKHA